MDDKQIHVDQRILCENNLATIKYIGEVPPTQGLWIGVEWDDPCRGKHDGSYGGKRYFKTEHPMSGSFVRPKKCSFGVSFMDAVQEKYGKANDENEIIDPNDMYVVGKNQRTAVMMVGVESVGHFQSQLDRLVSINLFRAGISMAGVDGEIALNLPSVTELDLTENLLSSWTDVEKIMGQMAKLVSLNISGNRLKLPDTPSRDNKSFQSIKVLCANRLSYDWQQISKCVSMFDNLKELYVGFNCISHIGIVPVALQQISFLNLEGNPLGDWKNVLAFGKLENLQTLKLNNTQLEHIYFPDCALTSVTGYFPKVADISLSGNNISDWASINELNKLQSLSELRILNNPLVTNQANKETFRQVIIARLRKLTKLNSMVVTRGERNGAEYDYLRICARDWKADSTDGKTEFMELHPHYQDLVDKFGIPDDSELKVESTAIKSSLISITIQCPLIPDAPITKKKKVPTATLR